MLVSRAEKLCLTGCARRTPDKRGTGSDAVRRESERDIHGDARVGGARRTVRRPRAIRADSQRSMPRLTTRPSGTAAADVEIRAPWRPKAPRSAGSGRAQARTYAQVLSESARRSLLLALGGSRGYTRRGQRARQAVSLCKFRTYVGITYSVISLCGLILRLNRQEDANSLVDMVVSV